MCTSISFFPGTSRADILLDCSPARYDTHTKEPCRPKAEPWQVGPQVTKTQKGLGTVGGGGGGDGRWSAKSARTPRGSPPANPSGARGESEATRNTAKKFCTQIGAGPIHRIALERMHLTLLLLLWGFIP
jgi:hypothetical protein